MYRFPRKEDLLAMTDPPWIARIPPVIRRLNLHQISPESPHLPLPEREPGSETQATRKLIGRVRHANVPWTICIFGSGVDGHIRLPMCINNSFHSPGATAQLSGARSTAELIAHHAGPPPYPWVTGIGGGLRATKRGNPTPPPFNYRILSRAEQSKTARLLSACSDLGK